MQVVEIRMKPRSGRTTTLDTMLKGFHFLTPGVRAAYMGFHDEMVDFCSNYGHDAKICEPFAALRNNNAPRDTHFLIDDFELNRKKWQELFPDSLSLQESLEQYESTGTAFIFTDEREDNFASIRSVGQTRTGQC